MDEPGRCRRTDGKKWRCSKAVIPNEKYCEKHMHRGCRSRTRAHSSCPDHTTSKVPPKLTKNKKMEDNGVKKIDNSNSKAGNNGITKIVSKSASSEIISGQINRSENQHNVQDNGCGYGRNKVEKIEMETSKEKEKNCIMGLDISQKRALQNDVQTSNIHRGAKKRSTASQEVDDGDKNNAFALVKRANELEIDQM